MSAPVISELSKAASSARARTTCRFLDLTGSDGARPVWHPGCAGVSAQQPIVAGIPSPMGFWLADGEANGAEFRLRVVEPGSESDPDQAELIGLRTGRQRPVQSVKIKAPHAGGGDLILTLGPGGARVEADAATWDLLSEPVLLAVAQYARFLNVDAKLDRLTEAARGDLDHAVLPSVGTLRHKSRLASLAREVRALLLDLPHFQGPLSDPYPFCTSERSASTYRTLAEKLHLEEWSEAIDDRAEAVEDIYESATEKLFEYRNFAWEAGLEVIIIVILIAELVFMGYEAFSP